MNNILNKKDEQKIIEQDNDSGGAAFMKETKEFFGPILHPQQIEQLLPEIINNHNGAYKSKSGANGPG